MHARVRLAVAAIILAVGSAQAADTITFVRLMADHGPRAEGNPLVAAGVLSLGVLPLVAAKVALVVLVVAVFAIVVRTHSRLGSAVATAGTAGGLIGAFANVAAL